MNCDQDANQAACAGNIIDASAAESLKLYCSGGCKGSRIICPEGTHGSTMCSIFCDSPESCRYARVETGKGYTSFLGVWCRADAFSIVLLYSLCNGCKPPSHRPMLHIVHHSVRAMIWWWTYRIEVWRV